MKRVLVIGLVLWFIVNFGFGLDIAQAQYPLGLNGYQAGNLPWNQGYSYFQYGPLGNASHMYSMFSHGWYGNQGGWDGYSMSQGRPYGMDSISPFGLTGGPQNRWGRMPGFGWPGWN